MRYLKTFVMTAPAFVLVGRFVPEQPMAWWPDAMIFDTRGVVGAVWSGRHLRRK